jgi:hypothetical protein
MTPKAQCIAIAQACGYSMRECQDGSIEWRYPDGGLIGRYKAEHYPSLVPKYTMDLNAMHEAEKVLDAVQLHSYANELAELCNLKAAKSTASAYRWHATAAQRQEAFLRALNLWRDDA